MIKVIVGTCFLLLILGGCTLSFTEPECVCECKDNSSYFECGGDVYKVKGVQQDGGSQQEDN